MATSSSGSPVGVEIVLQPPALEPGAAVREHGDDVAGLDADVALGCLADERAADGDGGRLDGVGGAGCGAAGRRRAPPTRRPVAVAVAGSGGGGVTKSAW